ncbi:hypothetical protein RB595_005535 [Gaeumannomyces hyphopodioides]
MRLMQVAVLDDYQGISEPHFEALDKSIFEVTTFKNTLLPYNHPDTPIRVKDELVTRLEPFTVICTMRERTPFPAELIARLPNLKLLLTTGVRNASIDLAACRERGIPVAGAKDRARGPAASGSVVPGLAAAGTDSTTQHCVAMILALARGLAADDAAVRAGAWQTGWALGLSGRTLGVLGLGRLGVSVARIMRAAFGMRVVAWSANLTQDAADARAAEAGLPVEDAGGEKTFRVVTREELFGTADVLSVHVVLSDRTRGLVGADDLARMKATALLVNTARGPVVQQRALLDVLGRGAIRGAALDVFDLEPLPLDSPWRTTEWGKDGRSQVLLTPHMGYVEKQTLDDWYAVQAENIQRWQKGQQELLVPF